jgi:hypothetical protein
MRGARSMPSRRDDATLSSNTALDLIRARGRGVAEQLTEIANAASD